MTIGAGFTHTLEDVPIFHTHRDDDREWDKDTLAEVVAVNNDRYSRGEGSCIIVGHTESESDQPPCIGVIDHLSLGERNGIPTIFARMHVDNPDLVVKDNPFRSVEIDETDLHIPYVAVLSDKEPALELGLLFSKEGQKIIKYGKHKITMKRLHKEKETPDMAVEDNLREAILEVLGETAEFAFLQKLMETKAEEAPAEEAPAEDVDQNEKEEDQPAEEAPAEEKAEEAPAEDEPKEEEDDTKKMSKELADLKKRLRQSEREKALVGLAAEGFNFDVAGELESSANLDDDQFNTHVVTKIRKYCKKAPMQKFSKIETPIVDKTGVAEQKQFAAQCAAYAREHKVSFQAAAMALSN